MSCRICSADKDIGAPVVGLFRWRLIRASWYAADVVESLAPSLGTDAYYVSSAVWFEDSLMG